MGNQLTIKGGGLTQAQILALIAANAAPVAHKTQHQDGGSDEITVQGLTGVLTAEQLSSWTGVSGKPTTFTPAAHNTSHQVSGSDVLTLTGLTGKINYVDRGDPSTNDFTIANFGTIGTFTDIDFSSIVPATATFIHLRAALKNTTNTNSTLTFRKNGNTNVHDSLIFSIPVTNVQFNAEGFVACDANRILEYRNTDSAINVADITVLGWFLP